MLTLDKALDAAEHPGTRLCALCDAAAELDPMLNHSASQTIRQRLFGVAADYTTAAAWSCIDARQLDPARSHVPYRRPA